MAVAEVNYFNEPLQKETGFIALLPDRQGRRCPFNVWYLLHGLSDDYSAWLRWTSLERYVRELPVIVILPDGDRSWYSDLPDKGAYETSIIDGLLPFVEEYFPTEGTRASRVIGGLSMGGYGAMKFAFKFPDLFCSVAAHSGAYDAANDADIGASGIDCCFQLAEQLDVADAPAIRFDCGNEDPLLDQNRRFHNHLEALGIPHEYHEFSGGHNWDYWDERVQQAVTFHCRVLGIMEDSRTRPS